MPDDVYKASKTLIDAKSDALQTLIDTKSDVKIATGNYVGTGAYGSSNPTVVNFPFTPKFIFICPSSIADGYYYGIAEYHLFASYGQLQNLFTTYGTDSKIKTHASYFSTIKSITNTQLSFYRTDAAIRQLNHEDYDYNWLAIG